MIVELHALAFLAFLEAAAWQAASSRTVSPVLVYTGVAVSLSASCGCSSWRGRSWGRATWPQPLAGSAGGPGAPDAAPRLRLERGAGGGQGRGRRGRRAVG